MQTYAKKGIKKLAVLAKKCYDWGVYANRAYDYVSL